MITGSTDNMIVVFICKDVINLNHMILVAVETLWLDEDIALSFWANVSMFFFTVKNISMLLLMI
jgi:hypothetical protein